MSFRDNKTTNVDGLKSFSFAHQESQIELILVHVSEASGRGPWRTLEFWTSNTMYGLDSELNCIEISARVPGANVPEHLMGARLVGSQSRDGDAFSAAFPYPVPGMEAVFRTKGSDKHMTTSVVERVMLRVRITNLDLGRDQVPDWSKITTVWQGR